MLSGVNITARWQDTLAGYLERKGKPETAIDAWAEEVVAADDGFADWVWRSGVHAYMAGELMVRDVELADDADERSAARGKVSVRKIGVSFLDLPWEEAIAFFAEKAVLTPAEFDALLDRYKAGGFTSRVLTSQAMREAAHRRITEALEQGTALDEIVRQLRDDEMALGVTPAGHGALENIARTNIAVAYGHGRHKAMTSPAVLKLRPYCQYWTAADSRVREAHRALHGKVFENGSPDALLYTPPLGFRCRCSMTTLSARQFKARELVLVSGPILMPDGTEARPDAGWEDPPAPLGPDDSEEAA